MIEIAVTAEFRKRYKSLPLSIKRKAEKLAPKSKQIWSFRIDKKYRIIFKFIDGNTALFLTVGPHDWIYTIKF